MQCSDTRPRASGEIRRRYKCPKCDARYTTIEQAIDAPAPGTAKAWKKSVLDRLEQVLTEEIQKLTD